MRTISINMPVTRTAVAVLAVAAAIGAWEVAGQTGTVLFLVPFSAALENAWELLTGPALMEHIVPSAVRALLGFGLGSLIGIVVGVPLGYVRGLDPWFRPTLEFLRATPLPAVLPVAFAAFGATDSTRIGLIALGALWPVLL